jgi:formylglycine-generating enzyme required for sulfatase activity
VSQHIKVSWLQLSEDVDSSEYLVYLLDAGATLVYGVTKPTNRLNPPGKGNLMSWAVPSVPEGDKRIAVVEVGNDGKTRFIINTTTSIAAGSPGSFLIPSNELVPQSAPSPVNTDQDSTGNGVMDSQDSTFVKNTIVSTITDSLGNSFIIVTLAGGDGTEEPRTVYTFGGDTPGQPPSYGGTGWPVCKVQGTINKVPPTTATVSSDGSGNLLINGLPVYQFDGDTGPQGTGGSIANWSTLDREGNPQGVDYINTNPDDIDGDGIPNIIDADYPGNDTKPDSDGDGIIDEGDTDDDNDGILDVNDADPLDANVGTTTTDTDGDGITDDLELQSVPETFLDDGTGIAVGGSIIPITGDLETFFDGLAGFSDGGSGASTTITKNTSGTGQEYTVPATSVPGMPAVSALYDPSTGTTTIITPGTTITIPPGGFIVTGVPKIQNGGGFQIGEVLNLYPTGTVQIGGASGSGEPADLLALVGDNDLNITQNNSSEPASVTVPGTSVDVYFVWNPLTGEEIQVTPGSTITLPPGFILIGGLKDIPVAVSTPVVSHSPNAINTLNAAHDPNAVITPSVGADPGVVNGLTVAHDPNAITAVTTGYIPRAPGQVTSELMNQATFVYGNDGTNGTGFYYPLYSNTTGVSNLSSLVIDGTTYYYDSTDINLGEPLQPSGYPINPGSTPLPDFKNWNYADKAFYEGSAQDVLAFTETTVTLSEAGVVPYTVQGTKNNYTAALNTNLGTSHDLSAYYFGDQLQQIFKQRIVTDYTGTLSPATRMVIDSSRFPIISAPKDENPNWTWSTHTQEVSTLLVTGKDNTANNVIFFQDHQNILPNDHSNAVYTKDSNNQITSFTIDIAPHGGHGWDFWTGMSAGTHTFVATGDDGTNYGSAPVYTDVGFPEGIPAGRYITNALVTTEYPVSGSYVTYYFISFTDPNGWYSGIYSANQAYITRSADNFREGGFFQWNSPTSTGTFDASSGTWNIDTSNWLNSNLPIEIYKSTPAVAGKAQNISIPNGITPANSEYDAEIHNPAGTTLTWDAVSGADRYELAIRVYGDGGDAAQYTMTSNSFQGSQVYTNTSNRFTTNTNSFTFPDEPFAQFEGLYFITVYSINDTTGEYTYSTSYKMVVRIDTDNDGTFNVSDTDDDGDGVLDTADQDSVNPNIGSTTTDTDSDGTSDDLDTDDDGDGVADTADAFPLDASETIDTDGDGTGDNADTDDDGDGVLDVNDLHPLDSTRSGVDTDSDGLDDAVDPFPSNASYGSTFTDTLTGSVDLEMIWSDPGTFMMGSPSTETGRLITEEYHQVTLTKGFYLGKYVVTQAQYEAVMTGNTIQDPVGTYGTYLSATPSYYAGDNRPVEQVSWWDVQSFLTRLNSQQSLPTGWSYVLPTEAQWEYACRAGTTTAYSVGSTISVSDANFRDPNNLTNYTGEHKDVGSYPANPWGFYDMHGNTYELCSDWWTTAYLGTDPVTDPIGNPSPTNKRVIKSGAYSYMANYQRSAARSYISNMTSRTGRNMSFRLALVGP